MLRCFRFASLPFYSSPQSRPIPKWTRALGIRIEAGAKEKTKYRCHDCGREYNLYDAICRECGGRDTLQKTIVRKETPGLNQSASSIGMRLVESLMDGDTSNGTPSGSFSARSKAWVQSTVVAKSLADIGKERNKSMERIQLNGRTGKEVSRVLGGGIVKGTLMLVGGDPGVGKSTLLLQIASMIAEQTEATPSKSNETQKFDSAKNASKMKVLYVSGEESAGQIYSRAERLGFGDQDSLYVMTETKVDSIVSEIMKVRPSAVVMDSIQSVLSSDAPGGPGGFVQVRECGIIFSHCAKNTNIPIFIVGHVTKQGDIAGPKVLEHIVDVVLYLEGERAQCYRILRGVKNRYGATDELGIFDMADGRLVAIENPNVSLLRDRGAKCSAASSAIAVSIDGTRPLLVEVEALCVPIQRIRETPPLQSGVDAGRLFMIQAILKRYVSCKLERVNLLVNVTAGMKVKEAAGDLAIAVAIASAYFGQPIRQDMALIGELGLGGDLRTVPHLEKRMAEVAQLGFNMVIVPNSRKSVRTDKWPKLVVRECATIVEVLEVVLGRENMQKEYGSKKKSKESIPDDEDEMYNDFEE